MKKVTLLILALSLMLAVQAMASGSSGVPRATATVPPDPLTVTETMKCTVTAIREDGTVLVRDAGETREHALRYDDKTKITAQNKKEFDGRKKLRIADLEVGRKLKVIHRPATGEVLKIKVLKSS